MKNRWVMLALSLLVVAVVGGLGAIASLDAAAFYATLRKPGWAPPAGVFGPVWTVLYLMMAVAVWRVWLKASRGEGGAVMASGAYGAYAAQLVLNALWSWLFFHWHLGLWAVIDILLLWFVLRLTLARFRRFDGVATLLLLPYLLWVAYAAALCAAVWRMNPGAL